MHKLALEAQNLFNSFGELQRRTLSGGKAHGDELSAARGPRIIAKRHAHMRDAPTKAIIGIVEDQRSSMVGGRAGSRVCD